jgi:predicted transcriptional regulator
MAANPLSKLGRRERQIMDVVYRRGRATVAEVREDLPDPPSYSAVRAMLGFLEDKGYLLHEQDGPRYVYLPAADPEQVRTTAVTHLLRTFFGNSMESAVAALLGNPERPPTRDELDRMASLIEDARRAPGGER